VMGKRASLAGLPLFADPSGGRQSLNPAASLARIVRDGGRPPVTRRAGLVTDGALARRSASMPDLIFGGWWISARHAGRASGGAGKPTRAWGSSVAAGSNWRRAGQGRSRIGARHQRQRPLAPHSGRPRVDPGVLAAEWIERGVFSAFLCSTAAKPGTVGRRRQMGRRFVNEAISYHQFALEMLARGTVGRPGVSDRGCCGAPENTVSAWLRPGRLGDESRRRRRISHCGRHHRTACAAI